jgi:hypothetical protein
LDVPDKEPLDVPDVELLLDVPDVEPLVTDVDPLDVSDVEPLDVTDLESLDSCLI